LGVAQGKARPDVLKTFQQYRRYRHGTTWIERLIDRPQGEMEPPRRAARSRILETIL
jgi:hypothetical protein